MCGIAGYIGDDRADLNLIDQRVEAMLQAMVHRGPDDWGMTIFDPAATVGLHRDDRVQRVADGGHRLVLGHRRLAIIDLRRDARQPMASCRGDSWIVFNGEIYNYLELRRQLQESYPFRTTSDTEVLLAAWQQWGEEMLGKLDGMFAFALWDKRRKCLFCARDPVGVKPFYYHDDGRSFLFASEPAALLRGLATTGRVDRTRLAEFLLYGMSDHGDGTFFEGVRQLPGGTWLRVRADGGREGPVPYWMPRDPKEDEEPGWIDQFHDTLRLCVTRQLRSDVRVGSCLSGGLDSGAIAVTTGEVLGGEARNFTALTIKSENFTGDESKQASQTAGHAGLTWEAVEADLSRLGEDVESMAGIMGEPFSSLSMLAQYLIMRRAREKGLKVMLDGQGGDELYVGYPRLAQRLVVDYLKQGHPVRSMAEAWGLWRRASISPLTIAAGNIFFRSPRMAHNRNVLRFRGLVEPDFLNNAREEVLHDLYASASMTQMQIRELRRFCLPRLLKYEDRNSMAHGVEARVPHLGQPMIEFALTLPPQCRVRGGWTKFSLRKSMESSLPSEITWSRRKRGFEVPQKWWVKRLSERCRKWIDALPSSAPISKEGVMKALKDDRAGTLWFWRLLSTALWSDLTGVKW